jgi:hypothetical protein
MHAVQPTLTASPRLSRCSMPCVRSELTFDQHIVGGLIEEDVPASDDRTDDDEPKQG